MAILSLLAKLGLDKTGFDTGLAAAGKQVEGFGASLKSKLGAAFGAGALLALARETIEYGDSLKELGERLGVTSLEAQQFAVAAKLGGADMEFFATKFDKLKKSMSDAISGGANPFAAFGLSVEKLSKMKPSEVVQVFADQINSVGISADQAVKFVDIFGKGAGRMINILGDLQNAKVGTRFFTDADLKRMNEADDVLTKTWHNVKVLTASLIGMVFAENKGAKRLADILAGRKPDAASNRPDTNIDESQILTNLEAADEARKTHMAIQDRIVARDKEIAKLLADIADDGMTNDEKRNKLLMERQVIMEKLAQIEAPGPEAPPEERQKTILELLKNQVEVTKIIEAIDAKKPHAFPMEKTTLGSIGGTLGNSGVRTEQIASESLRQLKEIKEQLGRRGIIVQSWR